MKAVEALQGKPLFQPVSFMITVETEEEAKALRMLCGYNVSAAEAAASSYKRPVGEHITKLAAKILLSLWEAGVYKLPDPIS